MTIRLARPVCVCVLALAANRAGAAQVDDATAVTMAMPHELIVAGDITPAQRKAILTPINDLYGFWNNGSPELLKKALSPEFFDHALPPGRPAVRKARPVRRRRPRASWRRCPISSSPCCSRWSRWTASSRRSA